MDPQIEWTPLPPAALCSRWLTAHGSTWMGPRPEPGWAGGRLLLRLFGRWMFPEEPGAGTVSNVERPEGEEPRADT
jgi:hypothetical protein